MSQQGSTDVEWLDVLSKRLRSLVKTLSVLKDANFEFEELHDARVACRRAEAALKVCRDLLPNQHVDWLREHLRRLRQVGNAARDDDVWDRWLEGQEGPVSRQLRRSLRGERQLNHARVAKFAQSLLRSRRFVYHVEQVCRSTRKTTAPSLWRSLIARRLLSQLNSLVCAIPLGDQNSRELHRFRIASKRLRYANEFVSEVIAESRSSTLEQLLKQIQDRLGVLNDSVMRQRRFKQLVKHEVRLKGLPDPARESECLTAAWQVWWASVAITNVINAVVANWLRLAVHQ